MISIVSYRTFWRYFWAWLGGFAAMSAFYITQGNKPYFPEYTMVVPEYSIRAIGASALFGTMIGLMALVMEVFLQKPTMNQFKKISDLLRIFSIMALGIMVWIVDKVAIWFLFEVSLSHVHLRSLGNLAFCGIGLATGIIVTEKMRIHAISKILITSVPIAVTLNLSMPHYGFGDIASYSLWNWFTPIFVHENFMFFLMFALFISISFHAQALWADLYGTREKRKRLSS